MKTDLNQLYLLDNQHLTFNELLDRVLYERLDLLNDKIEKLESVVPSCSRSLNTKNYNLESLHLKRDHLINMILVHENKVKEVKLDDVCYTVINS